MYSQRSQHFAPPELQRFVWGSWFYAHWSLRDRRLERPLYVGKFNLRLRRPCHRLTIKKLALPDFEIHQSP